MKISKKVVNEYLCDDTFYQYKSQLKQFGKHKNEKILIALAWLIKNLKPQSQCQTNTIFRLSITSHLKPHGLAVKYRGKLYLGVTPGGFILHNDNLCVTIDYHKIQMVQWNGIIFGSGKQKLILSIER